MANNDFNGEKMLETMANAQEYLEKALLYHDNELRKEIEVISKVIDKFQENPKKRVYRKIAKKSGMPFEMLIAIILPISNWFKNALDLNDKELRESIELFKKMEKRVKISFSELRNSHRGYENHKCFASHYINETH